MSNRTDWNALVDEIMLHDPEYNEVAASKFDGLRQRILKELHNAFVAGQEEDQRSIALAREALRVAQIELQGLRDFRQRATSVGAAKVMNQIVPTVFFEGRAYVSADTFNEMTALVGTAQGAIEALKAEIKAAVLTEREACARICDGIKGANYGRDQAWGVAEAIAKKIRERA